MLILCVVLALACAALAGALRRARFEAVDAHRRAEVAELLHDAVGGEVNRLRAELRARPGAYAGPVRTLPRPRVNEPAPACPVCAGLVIGTEVARHMRVPATEIRGPITPTEAPRAFIVRRGQA